MKAIRLAFAMLSALFLLSVPAPVRAGDNASDIDTQIKQLTELEKSLEMQATMLKATSHFKSNKKKYKRVKARLEDVRNQISTLATPKVDLVADVSDGLEPIGGPVPVKPLLPTLPIQLEPQPQPEPDPIVELPPLEDDDADDEDDVDDEDDADDDDADDNDAADEDDDADDEDDGDEEETEPHRQWLETFVDGKLEGVSDQEWAHALYNAYFEAYGILQADPTCPPDLLVEVAALCEQFKNALEAEKSLISDEEAGDDGEGNSDEEGVSDEDGGSDEDDSSRDEEAFEEEETGETEEVSAEPSWNGPYVDDPIPDFGAGGSSGGGSGTDDDDDEEDDLPSALPSEAARHSVSRSGGGVPSSMSQLYGRDLSSGTADSGFSYPTAGNYYGSGASGNASVATNYVDEIPYDLLKWKFGGFKPHLEAVRSSVTIADLRVDKDGLRMKWVRDIGAWGIPYEVPDGVACFFVKNESGEWVGGKFEWISSSRSTRQFTNIREGYNGWNLRGVPNPCEVAFVVFRKDGKRRSNIISGIWQR